MGEMEAAKNLTINFLIQTSFGSDPIQVQRELKAPEGAGAEHFTVDRDQLKKALLTYAESDKNSAALPAGNSEAPWRMSGRLRDSGEYTMLDAAGSSVDLTKYSEIKIAQYPGGARAI